MDAPAMPCVAILDTSAEIINLMRDMLEDEGIRSVSAYILDFKNGKQDLHAFFAAHRPQTIIYDVAPPYEENWAFFTTVKELSHTQDCHFVVTTTNKNALEQLVGPTSSIEFIGKPFDLSVLLVAVKRSLEQCP